MKMLHLVVEISHFIVMEIKFSTRPGKALKQKTLVNKKKEAFKRRVMSL